jgi:threonine/homoserine/homoserine lactone efflux protein
MDWHLLVPFWTATILLLIIPGPVVAIVTHNTLRGGAGAGVATVLGVELGRLSQFGATVAGLMISAEVSHSLFRWLSFVGVIYLVWLACQTLYLGKPRSRSISAAASGRPHVDGLAIAFSNPTTLVFYTAFLPQFIDPTYPVARQLLLLAVIFLTTSFLFELMLVLGFARLRLFASNAIPGFGRFAEVGSVVIYLSIAAIAILGFTSSPS